MEEVIKLDKLTKSYGQNRGVTDVTLAVEKGAVFGFLGPNGAGKTTTISMLVDLIRPSGGSISIFGLDSVRDSRAIRKRIGYLAGDFALDGHLTGGQMLTYLANLRGGVKAAAIHRLAERLDCDLSRPIKTLSRGNRQKIGLISALMHEPELLILDEPTSGLDPLIQAEFNKLLREHKQQGGTAFVSSHILSEVQEVCDHVAFVREGRLGAVEHTADLAARAPKQVRVTSSDKGLRTGMQSLKGFAWHYQEGDVLYGSYSGDVAKLLAALSRYELKDLNLQDADLETIFMKYYEGPQHA